MGQRLVITVQSGGENIARIYYHWSAYTRSALEEARDIVKCIQAANTKNKRQLQLALIRMCENAGGGIDGGLNGSEGEIIQEWFPNEKFSKKSPDRSYGLIAITKRGMDEILRCAEGVLTIDVDANMIYNDVFDLYTSEQWEGYHEEGRCIGLDDIMELHHDIEDVPFSEIDELLQELNIFFSNSIYAFRRGNNVYAMI